MLSIGHRQMVLLALKTTDANDLTDTSYCMSNFYLLKSMVQVNIITHISHSPKSEWVARAVIALSKIEVSLFQRLFWYTPIEGTTDLQVVAVHSC